MRLSVLKLSTKSGQVKALFLDTQKTALPSGKVPRYLSSPAFDEHALVLPVGSAHGSTGDSKNIRSGKNSSSVNNEIG